MDLSIGGIFPPIYPPASDLVVENTGLPEGSASPIPPPGTENLSQPNLDVSSYFTSEIEPHVGTEATPLPRGVHLPHPGPKPTSRVSNRSKNATRAQIKGFVAIKQMKSAISYSPLLKDLRIEAFVNDTVAVKGQIDQNLAGMAESNNEVESLSILEEGVKHQMVDYAAADAFPPAVDMAVGGDTPPPAPQVEEGCRLNSADEIAGAVHQMLRIIEEEATLSVIVVVLLSMTRENALVWHFSFDPVKD